MPKTPISPPKLPEVKIKKAKKELSPKEKDEFSEQVVQVDRISRVVAGGKRMRFRAAVVVGNNSGKVGLGVAKAADIVSAVQKAT